MRSSGDFLKPYIIRIVNWKKYHGREIKTQTQWLRFQNNFFTHPDFTGLTCEERLAWIYILCAASQLNSDTISVPDRVHPDVFTALTNAKRISFDRAVEKLKRLHIIEIRTTRGRYADDTQKCHYEDVTEDSLRSSSDGDETKRNETNTLSSAAPTSSARENFDLEKLYQSYPKKVGKGKGMERLAKGVKTQADYDACAGAIARYARYVTERGDEPRFVKGFDTFSNCWRDWVEPDAGTAQVKPLSTMDPENEAYWKKVFGEDYVAPSRAAVSAGAP